MATGKEKINAAFELIKQKHQSLIKGNTIRIESYELEQLKIPLLEQSQVLEVLADDLKCIKYSAEPLFKTEDDIDPQTRVDIMEASDFSSLTERQMLDDLMAQQIYVIDVLDGFEQAYLTYLSDEPQNTFGPITYDDEHAKATYKGKVAKLFNTNTVKSVLAAQVFRADGARLRTTDIIFAIEALRIAPDKDLTTRTLTNAKDAVNRSLEAAFGVGDVICYEREEFWLNDKYCSLASSYRARTE